jgi:glycosyltransferase involved in cell wall biosynthesis
MLRIPPNAFVVGGVGTTDWRKAPDVFVQVAAALLRLNPEVEPWFVWLGGHGAGLAEAELRHDVLLTGLEGHLHFVAAQPNPLDYLAAFDVLALTSREDPFPLVCLEAATVGKPTVCFESAGGAPEFVEADAGRVVPYLDVDAFARALSTLANDRESAAKLGQRAQRKVEAYDVNVIGPQVARIIETTMSRKVRPTR